MSTWTNKDVLAFLERHAPQAPFSQGISLAREFDETQKELYEAREAMAVLSTILFDKHGNILPKYEGSRFAVKLALDCVMKQRNFMVEGHPSGKDHLEWLMGKMEKRNTIH